MTTSAPPASTAERAKVYPWVLVTQDTTELNRTAHPLPGLRQAVRWIAHFGARATAS
ncbi:MAG: hypothetical protein NZ693_09595 [Thermoflexales bacterium]|nr:hypothetical protein [Thermoflexales bacterium]